MGDDFHLQILEERGHFLWHVGSIGHSSLSWARPPFSWQRIVSCGWDLHHQNCVGFGWAWSRVGCLCWGILLVGCVLLMLAVFPISRGCVFFPCCVGVKKGCCKSTSPCCWSTSLWGYLLHMEGRWELPYHPNCWQNHNHMTGPSLSSSCGQIGAFLYGCVWPESPNSSIADLSLIFERYSYFNLLVIDTALILIKNTTIV